MKHSLFYKLAGLAFAVAVLGLAALTLKFASYGPDSSESHRVTQVVGGSFSLVATDGTTVTPATWPGKLLLITFGYRFCPDVCPTNLGRIAGALNQLGEDANRVQPLFITVDPDRDTVEALRPYVELFHPRLLGLTGTRAQIGDVTRTFRIYYKKVPGATPETYSMDHDASLYITDDRGTLIKVFSRDATEEQLSAGLKTLLEHAGSGH